MAAYLMNVPVVAQTKTMSCWHASAQMIWWYWQRKTGRQGPMFTLAGKWSANKGLPITPHQHIALARAVGMKSVSRKRSYSSSDLVNLLRRHGPLWCCGKWFGFYHIVVLTGVNGDIVHINDPDRGVRKTRNVAWFNRKMVNDFDGCFMAKDPAAY